MISRFKEWHAKAESRSKRFHVQEYVPPSVNYLKTYVYEVRKIGILLNTEYFLKNEHRIKLFFTKIKYFKVFKRLKAEKTENGQPLYKDIKLTFDREGIKLDPTKKPIYLPTILANYAPYLPPNMQKPKYVPDR